MAKKKRVEKRTAKERGIVPIEFGDMLPRIRAEVKQGSVGAWVREACERRLEGNATRLAVHRLAATSAAKGPQPMFTREMLERCVDERVPARHFGIVQDNGELRCFPMPTPESDLAGLAQREATHEPSPVVLISGQRCGKMAQMRANLASNGGGFLFSEAHGTEVVPAENLVPTELAEGGPVNLPWPLVSGAPARLASRAEGEEMVRALFNAHPTIQAEGHAGTSVQGASPSEGALISDDRCVTDARVQTGASAPVVDAADRPVGDDWWR